MLIVAALALLAPSAVTSQNPFSAVAREAFGSFAGVQYTRLTGRFSGKTSLGDFRMPFELVAPADPRRGNRTVLVEPPHDLLGPFCRDAVLGRRFVFDGGFAYAAVGFGNSGLNVLDSTASDARLAGAPLVRRRPGVSEGAGSTVDEEILIQFVNALTESAFAREALGPIERRYALGLSQTSAALLETLNHPQGRGLFDLTVLLITMWRPPWQSPGVLERLEGAFEPPSGVARVIFVESEGDLLLSEAASFRRVAPLEGFRVYELAGLSHRPTTSNPTDGSPVARAMFLRGDAWVRQGTPPPASVLLEVAPSGAVDPVHGIHTGILRDDDGNARGGVRLPDVAIGRARFVRCSRAPAGALAARGQHGRSRLRTAARRHGFSLPQPRRLCGTVYAAGGPPGGGRVPVSRRCRGAPAASGCVEGGGTECLYIQPSTVTPASVTSSRSTT